MNVLPLRDLVIVKREKAEEVSKGGIIIPQTAQKKSIFGIVVAIGKGRYLENGARVEPEVKKDDRVLIQEWVGQEIQLDDGEIGLVLKEESLQGVIEE